VVREQGTVEEWVVGEEKRLEFGKVFNRRSVARGQIEKMRVREVLRGRGVVIGRRRRKESPSPVVSFGLRFESLAGPNETTGTESQTGDRTRP
jgi:hypothetical protein